MPKRNQLRDRIHRKSLIREQNFSCKYCGNKVFNHSTLQKYRNVTKVSNFLFWNSPDGMAHSIRIATTEHIIPLKSNGRNCKTNKCVVCERCNLDKDLTNSRDLILSRHICKCGRIKRSVKHRKCVYCQYFLYGNRIYSPGWSYLI